MPRAGTKRPQTNKTQAAAIKRQKLADSDNDSLAEAPRDTPRDSQKVDSPKVDYHKVPRRELIQRIRELEYDLKWAVPTLQYHIVKANHDVLQSQYSNSKIIMSTQDEEIRALRVLHERAKVDLSTVLDLQAKNKVLADQLEQLQSSIQFRRMLE